MRNYITLIAVFIISAQAYATGRLELWLEGEQITYVERNEKGQFQGYGSLRLESWNHEDQRSEWIARKSNGTFATGYKGYLEKFKVKGLKKEQTRLVIRNKKGHFITWLAMDHLLKSGYEKMDFDKDGKKETVYIVRYQGKFVNWAPAKLERWANFEYPVLVVRDSADSTNNGKILSWIAPEVMENGQIIYRDPATGQFVSPNL